MLSHCQCQIQAWIWQIGISIGQSDELTLDFQSKSSISIIMYRRTWFWLWGWRHQDHLCQTAVLWVDVGGQHSGRVHACGWLASSSLNKGHHVAAAEPAHGFLLFYPVCPAFSTSPQLPFYFWRVWISVCWSQIRTLTDVSKRALNYMGYNA